MAYLIAWIVGVAMAASAGIWAWRKYMTTPVELPAGADEDL